jgi:hypothetical protein
MFWPFTIFGGFPIVIFVLAILATIVWIWALIDCLQNPRLDGTEKLVWVVVILFTHFIGAIIYLAIGRQSRITGA